MIVSDGLPTGYELELRPGTDLAKQVRAAAGPHPAGACSGHADR